MNIFKNLFSRKNHNKIILRKLDNLDEFDLNPLLLKEEEMVSDIIELLNNHLKSHVKFLKSDKHAQSISKKTSNYFTKSCIELVLLDWVYLTNTFANNQISVNVGKYMYVVLLLALKRGASDLLDNSDDFHDVIERRSVVYSQVLSDLSAETNTSLQTMASIKILIVDYPFTDHKYGDFIGYGFDFDIISTDSFNVAFNSSFGSIVNRINQIISK